MINRINISCAILRTLSLVNLCPEVVKAVFEGSAPESLTLRKVMYGFPDDREEQKRVLGLQWKIL